MVVAVLTVAAAGQNVPPVEPVPFAVPAGMPDRAASLAPGDVQLRGFLGARVLANEAGRLRDVDLEPLLAGFRHKPGTHPWIGEHIGKWMHAATLAWANTGDAVLGQKLRYAAAELIKAQEPDGYLGTYTPQTRFGLFENADWDVWSHKYCLIGLLTYHRFTGVPDALACCTRIAGLLEKTFGPGKKSILSAGTHMGMAATSVLEPIVLLYRLTGDPRHLEFARYIVGSWDEQGGPGVLATLAESGQVSRTANGKAYEMLSNLVGLCELARASGDRRYLDPVLRGWEDVREHHLYVTGTASYGEHFHNPFELPNGMSAAVGETCVTVTWMQLCQQLLCLTGDARYGDELERSLYNQLAGAQRPDGRQWCYYTALEGVKEYSPGINCCVSSGPRAMAMAPTMAYYVLPGPDRLAVNLFESSRATVRLSGTTVGVEQEGSLFEGGGVTLTLRPGSAASFGVLVRAPAWAQAMAIRECPSAQRNERGWLEVPARQWNPGDVLHIGWRCEPRVVQGDHANAGKAALALGPMVFAYDVDANQGRGLGACERFATDSAEGILVGSRGGLPTLTAPLLDALSGVRRTGGFVPFAAAGAAGGRYRVWLDGAGSDRPCSLLASGTESRSTPGNVPGSIVDGDPSTFVVTWDSSRHAEEWFGVELERPVTIGRIAYAHGRTFHDGGWFDASGSGPVVEIRRDSGGPWQRVGVLAGYPGTTATDAKGLRGGERFELALSGPVQAVGVRIRGAGACGDNPAQSFSSCGELSAYPE